MGVVVKEWQNLRKRMLQLMVNLQRHDLFPEVFEIPLNDFWVE